MVKHRTYEKPAIAAQEIAIFGLAHCKKCGVIYDTMECLYMTLWSINHPTIRVINTPTMSYITPISVVCILCFLQCRGVDKP